VAFRLFSFRLDVHELASGGVFGLLEGRLWIRSPRATLKKTTLSPNASNQADAMNRLCGGRQHQTR
jgi:hypothetical protein